MLLAIAADRTGGDGVPLALLTGLRTRGRFRQFVRHAETRRPRQTVRQRRRRRRRFE